MIKRRLISILVLASLVLSVIALTILPMPVLAATNTLSFYTTTSDGYIEKSDADYATAQAAATGTQFTGTQATIGQKTGFNVYRGFLYIDTANIPDTATITAATLYIYGAADYSTTDFDIVVRSGMPTYPHDPLVGADFDKTLYSGDGGSVSTSTFTTSGYNAIVLNATGYGWVNQTGDTKFALISQEDISASAPADNEYVTIYLNDQTGTDKDPYLLVTYTYTGTPELVTQAATSIEDFTATLNGLITGADGITKRGFDWGTSASSYDFEWIEEGSHDVGTFSHGISNLSPGITYHFRAKAYSATYGWGYGDDTAFIKQGVGVVVGTSTSSLPVGYYGFAHQLFYANGRHWAFYSDGTNVVCKNSPDGISWSSATIIRPLTTFASNQFDVWYDGSYFHYSYSKPDTANYAIYYRRGLPNSDGSITWSAAEQVALAADASYQFDNSSMAVDTDGYPWIGYVRHPSGGAGAASRPFVIKSSTNDGIWTTAGGYPYMLEDTQIVQYSHPTPLTNGKVYVVYSGCALPVKGRLWDGASWGGVETVSTSLNDDYQISAVAYNDDIHLVFIDTAPKAAIHIKRTYGVGWGDETDLGNPTVGSGEFPIICANWNGDLYMFWANYPTSDHIYYLKYTLATSSWDTIVTTANDWITETDLYTAQYSTLSNAPDGKVGLLYRQGNDATRYVKYAYLNAPPSIQVTTSTATNIEETSATIQGTLVNDGGGTCSVRFQWGHTPVLANDTVWQGGKVTGNIFNQSLTNLATGTTYYYRAQAKWADGTIACGMSQSFTTLTAGQPTMSAPSSFTATRGDTTVVLSWAKDPQATNTLVRRSTTGYPTSTISGTEVYLGSGSSVTDTGLTNSQAYYYSAWSETSGSYSASYATAFASPAGSGAGALPPPNYMAIGGVLVYGDYLENGDQLIVFSYFLTYTITPDVPVRDYFAFELYDGGTLRARVPVPYWGQMVGCIYLSPTSALTWGQSFTIKLTGIASQWSVIPEVSFPATNANWNGSQSITGLASYILSTAAILDDSWILHSPTGDVLTTEAGVMFNKAIPSLAAKVPEIFATSVGFPDAERETHDDAYQRGLTKEANLGSYIPGRIEEIGNVFGVEADAMGTALIILLALGFAVLIAWLSKSAGWALASGLVPLIWGNYTGLMPLAPTMIVAGLLATYTFYHLWISRA